MTAVYKIAECLISKMGILIPIFLWKSNRNGDEHSPSFRAAIPIPVTVELKSYILLDIMQKTDRDKRISLLHTRRTTYRRVIPLIFP